MNMNDKWKVYKKVTDNRKIPGQLIEFMMHTLNVYENLLNKFPLC